MLRLSLFSGACALVALTAVPLAHAEVGPGNPKTPTTEGNTITITVSGTGVSGGSAGHAATRTVSVPSPCWYRPGKTGKDYYEWVTSGEAERLHRQTGEDGDFEPFPGYERYKDDDQGHWYGGGCSSDRFNGDLDAFFAYVHEWIAAHGTIYVPAGQTPPVPPIPPEVLRDAASDAMTLLKPGIDWNPQRKGDASTLVNVDTWVWLTDRRTSLYVEATANTLAGPMSARVDAGLQSMTVSAPGTDPVQCAGAGVPYSQGATGECSIRFNRASPRGGKTPVTTSTTWSATWSFNGVDRGPIPVQPAAQTQITNVGVREIQAVVR
jgi:hypothetical protein